MSSLRLNHYEDPSKMFDKRSFTPTNLASVIHGSDRAGQGDVKKGSTSNGNNTLLLVQQQREQQQRYGAKSSPLVQMFLQSGVDNNEFTPRQLSKELTSSNFAALRQQQQQEMAQSTSRKQQQNADEEEGTSTAMSGTHSKSHTTSTASLLSTGRYGNPASGIRVPYQRAHRQPFEAEVSNTTTTTSSYQTAAAQSSARHTMNGGVSGDVMPAASALSPQPQPQHQSTTKLEALMAAATPSAGRKSGGVGGGSVALTTPAGNGVTSPQSAFSHNNHQSSFASPMPARSHHHHGSGNGVDPVCSSPLSPVHASSLVHHDPPHQFEWLLQQLKSRAEHAEQQVIVSEEAAQRQALAEKRRVELHLMNMQRSMGMAAQLQQQQWSGTSVAAAPSNIASSAVKDGCLLLEGSAVSTNQQLQHKLETATADVLSAECTTRLQRELKTEIESLRKLQAELKRKDAEREAKMKRAMASSSSSLSYQ